MTCKYCGTSLDGIRPDEQGVITCPGCGKRFIKRRPPETAHADEPAPARRVDQTSGFKKFMNMKLGGKVPAWCAAAAALVVVIVLAVVLFSSGSGNGSPKALLSLYEDALEGDLKAMWNIAPPYERQKEYGNSYSAFKEDYSDYKGEGSVDLEFIEYKKLSDFSKDDEYGRQESGVISFKYKYKIDGETKDGESELPVVKIDGKWYMNPDSSLY